MIAKNYVRAVCIVMLSGALTACGLCGNEDVSEHSSPNSQWKYVSFNRNCGATTGANLQVSILPAESVLPNVAGNVFIADDDHGAAKFVAFADWISPSELKITYSAKARIFKKESKVGPISITYVVQ